MSFEKEIGVSETQAVYGKLRRVVESVGNSVFSKNRTEMEQLGFAQKELELLVDLGYLEFDESVTKAFSPTEKFYRGER